MRGGARAPAAGWRSGCNSTLCARKARQLHTLCVHDEQVLRLKRGGRGEVGERRALPRIRSMREKRSSRAAAEACLGFSCPANQPASTALRHGGPYGDKQRGEELPRACVCVSCVPSPNRAAAGRSGSTAACASDSPSWLTVVYRCCCVLRLRCVCVCVHATRWGGERGRGRGRLINIIQSTHRALPIVPRPPLQL